MLNKTLFLTIFFFFAFPSFVYAATYYVATNGNNSNNCTSLTSPCLTISSAVAKLKEAGDTLYIRGGIYHESVYISASGISTNPITVANYNSEEVIIDGSTGDIRYSIPTRQGGGALVTLRGNYIAVRNLTTRYSGDRGFNVLGDHDTVENSYTYENWGSGIYMGGNYDTAQNNTVRSCSMKYYYYVYTDPAYPGYYDWSTGITCARYPMYGTIRNNISYDNWGHGISTYEAEYTTVEGNTSYNNMKLNYYVSDAKYILFKNNFSYCTPGNSRNQLADNFQYGIYVGDELGHPDPFPNGTGRVPSSDNIFVNNLSMGCDKNLSTKTAVSNNDLFAYNTLVNADANGDANLEFRSGSCTNCRFINNIVVQENTTPIALNSGSGMTFSHNLWSRTPPDYFTIMDGKPIFANPLLAKTGQVIAGLLTPDYFKLLSNSPAIDNATPLMEVSEDFFNSPRGSAPDIGAYEYVGSISTPTPIPCPIKPHGDADCNGVVNLLDFETWRREFLGIDTTTKADFDSSGGVTILDFEIWRRGFLGQ